MYANDCSTEAEIVEIKGKTIHEDDLILYMFPVGASQQRAIQITSWFMHSPGVESPFISLQLNIRYCQITFMDKDTHETIIVKDCYKT